MPAPETGEKAKKMLEKLTQHTGKIALILGVVFLLSMVLLAEAGSGYTFASKNKGGSNKGGGTTNSGLALTVKSSAIYNGKAQSHLAWGLKDIVPGVDKFFDFDDVKPGDYGHHKITVKIEKNPAFVCLDFVNLKDLENGHNEPESLVDFDDEGELSRYTKVFAWYDDGDGVFEVGETSLFSPLIQTVDMALNEQSYTIADATTGAISKGAERTIGLSWCLGEMTVNTATAEIACNGRLAGNILQGDSMTLDVRLRAVQAANNDGFLCNPEEDPEIPEEPEEPENPGGCKKCGGHTPRDPFDPVVPTSTIPTIPTIPTLPTTPGLPTTPTLPTLPTLPTTPTLPNLPTLPTLPGSSFGTGTTVVRSSSCTGCGGGQTEEFVVEVSLANQLRTSLRGRN